MSDTTNGEEQKNLRETINAAADVHGQITDANLADAAAKCGLVFRGVATLRARLVREGILEDMAAHGVSRVVRL